MVRTQNGSASSAAKEKEKGKEPEKEKSKEKNGSKRSASSENRAALLLQTLVKMRWRRHRPWSPRWKLNQPILHHLYRLEPPQAVTPVTSPADAANTKAKKSAASIQKAQVLSYVYNFASCSLHNTLIYFLYVCRR